jgi:hypothetical protein
VVAVLRIADDAVVVVVSAPAAGERPDSGGATGGVSDEEVARVLNVDVAVVKVGVLGELGEDLSATLAAAVLVVDQLVVLASKTM